MAENPIAIAAIDAGSNGIKMLLGEIDEQGTLWELDSVREAVRLGHDAFTTGEFGEKTLASAVDAFKHFKELMEAQGVGHVWAVATSACRTARNGAELVRRVRKATGIELEVIDGMQEARLTFQAIARKIYMKDKDALLVDMGGGSVEVTVARGGRVLGCETLEIGPVRLLEKLERDGLEERDAGKLLAEHEGTVRRLIKQKLAVDAPDLWIGTGGNIEALGQLRTQLCEKGNPAKIKPADLDKILSVLLDMSVEKRIKRLRLKPDRADVIAIAAIVLRMILAEARAVRLLIPDVGLLHGVLHELAQELKPHQWVRQGG